MLLQLLFSERNPSQEMLRCSFTSPTFASPTTSEQQEQYHLREELVTIYGKVWLLSRPGRPCLPFLIHMDRLPRRERYWYTVPVTAVEKPTVSEREDLRYTGRPREKNDHNAGILTKKSAFALTVENSLAISAIYSTNHTELNTTINGRAQKCSTDSKLSNM